MKTVYKLFAVRIDGQHRSGFASRETAIACWHERKRAVAFKRQLKKHLKKCKLSVVPVQVTVEILPPKVKHARQTKKQTG